MFTLLSLLIAFAGAGGAEPYTPTRLDWLVQELNLCCRSDALASTPGPVVTLVTYGAKPPDTVMVYLMTSSSAAGRPLTDVGAQAKRFVEARARDRKWAWVKTEISNP